MRERLDATVVNIELTLVSIIQGVALSFLTENARAIVQSEKWSSLVYVAAGLCIIFIFWSRSVIHTLTVINWPLRFGHNFFYIGCALAEAILFTRLEQPFQWFALSAAYAGAVWLLFIYDLRLVRDCLQQAAHPAQEQLYTLALKDQRLNIYFLLPLLFFLNLGCAVWLRHLESETRHGSVWLAAAQLGSFIIYLVYVTRFFRKLAPLILRREEGSRSSASAPGRC